MPSEPPVFHSLALAEVRPETDELVYLALTQVPAELAAVHTAAGQYVQIQEGEGKPGFFALACGPGRGRFEFLIKRGAPLADALAAKKAGDAIRLSAPAGKGYPLAQAEGKDVCLFAAGSGIAPLRAAVHAILKDRAKYGKVSLYYGVRAAKGFAFAEEMKTWAAQGVEVHRVCSQPAPGSWDGATGHVQKLLGERKPDLSKACAFACGMKGMVEGVKAACAELGLPPERVYQNF